MQSRGNKSGARRSGGLRPRELGGARGHARVQHVQGYKQIPDCVPSGSATPERGNTGGIMRWMRVGDTRTATLLSSLGARRALLPAASAALESSRARMAGSGGGASSAGFE